MVDPYWSGVDIFEASSGTTMIKPRGTASASTTTYDSNSFTFSGSAWDAASSSVVTSNFSIQNNVISPTSSLFTISGTNGTSLLTISEMGDVSVKKDLSVNGRLFLGLRSGLASTSTYIFIDDSESPTSTYIATNADGWQTSSTYDYAERFHSNELLVPGDLVTTDPSGVNLVKRSVSQSDTILGIVSTRPGFVTGGYIKGTYPIALAGRVPTRVSTANGGIAPGDQLAPSNIPGVAVKAVGAGSVVGVALEAYSASEEGSISVFVQPGWKGGDLLPQGSGTTYVTQSVTVSQPTTLKRAGLAKIYAGSNEVKVNFESLNAYPLINATPYELINGSWGVRAVTDKGFTIILGEAQTFDLTFSWTAEPSQAGYVMSFSDNSSAPYDEMSGLIYGPLVPEPEIATTTSSTEPVIPTSTEPVVSVPTESIDPDVQTSSTPAMETETTTTTS